MKNNVVEGFVGNRPPGFVKGLENYFWSERNVGWDRELEAGSDA